MRIFEAAHIYKHWICEFILPPVRTILSSVYKGLWRFSTKKCEVYFLGTLPAPQIQILQNPWKFERKGDDKKIKWAFNRVLRQTEVVQGTRTMRIQPCKDVLPWWAPGSESRKTTGARLASVKEHWASLLSCFQWSRMKIEIGKDAHCRNKVHDRKKGMGWWNSQGGQAHPCAQHPHSEGNRGLPVCLVNQENWESNSDPGFYSHTDLHTLWHRCPCTGRDRERHLFKASIVTTLPVRARTNLNQLQPCHTAWLRWLVHKQCRKHVAVMVAYQVSGPQAASLLPCSAGAVKQASWADSCFAAGIML